MKNNCQEYTWVWAIYALVCVQYVRVTQSLVQTQIYGTVQETGQNMDNIAIQL